MTFLSLRSSEPIRGKRRNQTYEMSSRAFPVLCTRHGPSSRGMQQTLCYSRLLARYPVQSPYLKRFSCVHKNLKPNFNPDPRPKKNFQPNPSPKSKLGWISKVFQTLANTKPCKYVTLGQHPLLICQPGSLIPRRDLCTFPTSSLWVNPFRLLISYTIRYAIGSWWPVLPALIPHRFSHAGFLHTFTHGPNSFSVHLLAGAPYVSIEFSVRRCLFDAEILASTGSRIIT